MEDLELSSLTFGSWFQGAILDNLEPIAKLANNTPILLVDKHDLTAGVGAMAALHIGLARLEISRIVSRKLLAHGRLGPG